MATIKTRVTTEVKLPSGKVITVTEDKNLDYEFKLAKNFTVKELANKEAKDAVKFIINSKTIEFISMVQELRNIMGVPFNINSNFRTVSYNKGCKGASPNSLHLDGLAMDISFPKCANTTWDKMRINWEAICKKHGKIGGINRYANFIHISIGEEKFGNKKFVVRDYRGKK